MRRCGQNLQQVWAVLETLRHQAQTGGVEKAARAVQPGASYRVVQGVHGVANFYSLIGIGLHIPGGFVHLGQAADAPGLAAFQSLQVFGKLPHHVAARNPHWQLQALDGGRTRQRERYVPMVRVGVCRADPVMHRCMCGYGRRLHSGLGRAGHGALELAGVGQRLLHPRVVDRARNARAVYE